MKKLISRISRSRKGLFILRSTPGEIVRDTILDVGKKAAEESAYKIGNATDVTDQIVKKYTEDLLNRTVSEFTSRIIRTEKTIGRGIGRGVEFVTSGETANSLGRIAFKTTKDVTRGDKVCTGLCLVSGACEIIALSCSTINVIPYRGRIYLYAKTISRGCMTYRNICAGEGC